MKRLVCFLLAVLLVAAMSVSVFAAISINDLALQTLDLVYSRDGGIIPESYAYYALFLTSSVTSDNRITIMFSETPVISADSPVAVYVYSGNGGSPSRWAGSSVSYIRSAVRETDAAVFIYIRHPGSVTAGTPVHAEKYIANLSTARIYDQSVVEDGLKVLSPNLTWVRTINLSLPDTSALQALVNECNQVDEAVYTPASRARFQNALQAARTLLAQSIYTQNQVAAVQAELQAAMEGLTVKPPPEESSEPDKPPPVVIGGYDVPDSMINAVGSGDVMGIVTGFSGPFLDHAMSAFSVVVPLLGVYLAIKLGPKIFRFFVR